VLDDQRRPRQTTRLQRDFAGERRRRLSEPQQCGREQACDGEGKKAEHSDIHGLVSIQPRQSASPGSGFGKILPDRNCLPDLD
jgi:hypothetical protein